MDTGQTKQPQHWIYVLGGAELRKKAHKWEQRKTRQGKAYAVIEDVPGGADSGKFSMVNSDDVLYILADAVREGKLGEWAIDPEDLARRLRAGGLIRTLGSLKIFASHSGDRGSSASYAEQVYATLRPEYPDVTVFGYRGNVDAEGFDGHKTAGLGDNESLQALGRDQWLARGVRAKDNRVQFPPEGEAAQR